MFKFLLNHLQRRNNAVHYSQQREQAIQMSNGLGFFNNLLIFIIKFMIGLTINSIAIISDAINNLSDMLSIAIALFSVHLAHKPADDEHPEGHGRFEYIGSLAVSFVVFAIGFELLMQSITRYTLTEKPELSSLAVLFMALTMGIKLWMFFYNRYVAVKYHSEMNQALAVDSITDVLTSTMILVSLALNPFTSLPLDAIGGTLIALMIMYSAFNISRKMVSRLLGALPDHQTVQKIKHILLKEPTVQQFHDLKLHDYGPNRMMGSVHVEMFDTLDLVQAHEIIDALEQRIFAQTHIVMTIHLDPIAQLPKDSQAT